MVAVIGSLSPNQSFVLVDNPTGMLQISGRQLLYVGDADPTGPYPFVITGSLGGRLSDSVDFIGSTFPDPPSGFLYLLGNDGSYLLGADSDYLLGAA